MIAPAHCELFDLWAAKGEIPEDRRTRQFVARYLADLVAQQRALAADPAKAPDQPHGDRLPFAGSAA